MTSTQNRAIWLRILASLALVVLTCGLKNYLAFMVAGTSLCPYLCPSVMSVELSFTFPVLSQFFAVQIWIQETLQSLPGMLLNDPYKLATALLFAPVLEEAIYRGPMYLSRNIAGRSLWWSIGIVLAVVFAMSHGRSGVALLPLIMMGIGSFGECQASCRPFS